MRRDPGRARRGFTMVELMLSVSLMLAVFGMSLQLFRNQSKSMATQSGRLSSQQNARFAIASLDRELRAAGIGVVDAQPLLVMAAPLAITFNADLVSIDTGDLGAVYIDQTADSAGVDVMRTSEKLALPLNAKLYPDTTYMQASGVPSLAETVS